MSDNDELEAARSRLHEIIQGALGIDVELIPAISEAAAQYRMTALFASVNEQGSPLDAPEFDLCSWSELATLTTSAVVAQFIVDHRDDCARVAAISGWMHVGHSLWLSRNGHGAGFFDGDIGGVSDRLQDAARSLGESSIYISDDGEFETEG